MTTTLESSGIAPPDFRAIFDGEYAYVRATAQRLGIRERELPDLVHDVFVTVHRKLSDFDSSRPLRPWLFGITFRVVVGHKRRLEYRREVLGSDTALDPIDETASIDERMEAAERRRLVHQALEALDDEKRAVFVLHEIDETPMPQIALALGIPTNTAYSRLRLGRDEFRRAIARILARSRRNGGPP